VDLAATQTREFDRAALPFYQGVWSRLLPAAIVGLPLWAWRARRSFADPGPERGRDVLVWMPIVFAIVYGLGWLTRYTFAGRVISWLAIALQIGAALEVARLWRRLGWASWGLTVLALASLLVTRHGSLIAGSWSPSDSDHPSAALLAGTGPDDVVLSDLRTSMQIPILTGKVVGWKHTLAWVPDFAERREDSERLFAADTDDASGAAILSRWGVRFIGLDRGRFPDPAIEARCRRLGEWIRSDDRYSLYRVPQQGLP
jgi:hypothetical protein